MFPAPYVIASSTSPTYKVRRHVFKFVQRLFLESFIIKSDIATEFSVQVI